MSPFELLKRDHRQVARILKRIESLKPGTETEQRDLLVELANEMETHADVEESIFYPQLQKIDETRALALEAIEEHRLVKQLLDELKAMPPEAETWRAKFAVLKENILHHVEEEEGELFSRARQSMKQKEISQLGAALEEARAKHETLV